MLARFPCAAMLALVCLVASSGGVVADFGNGGGTNGAQCQAPATRLGVGGSPGSGLDASGVLVTYCTTVPAGVPGGPPNRAGGQASSLLGQPCAGTRSSIAQLQPQLDHGGSGYLWARFWSGSGSPSSHPDGNPGFDGTGDGWATYQVLPQSTVTEDMLLTAWADGSYTLSTTVSDIQGQPPALWTAGPNGLVCSGGSTSFSSNWTPRVQPVGSPGVAPPPAGYPITTLASALESIHAGPSSVVSTITNNFVVFDQTACMSLSPHASGASSNPPKTVTVLGAPDALGAATFFTYYLQVSVSSEVHWNFGDGTAQDVDVDTSNQCVKHVYKQISDVLAANGYGSPAGVTVTAAQDVTITAFVFWTADSGQQDYRCVALGGGAGTTYGTFAQAQSGCSFVVPSAIQHVPFGPKPIYQVVAVPYNG